MECIKVLKNEKGLSLIVVAMATTFAIVTLSIALSVHIDSRRNRILRVKETLKLMETMEVAAKDVRAQWESATIAGSTPVIQLMGFSPCGTACYQKYGAMPNLCYENKSMPSEPYCFYGVGLSAQNSLDMELKYNVPELEPTAVEVAWNKIFEQKRDLPEWVDQAYAAPVPSPRTDTVAGPALNCIAGNRAGSNRGCMVCGAGSNGANWLDGSAVAGSRPCARIFSCPKLYKACETYSGATPSGALFVQDFYLSPAGDKD